MICLMHIITDMLFGLGCLHGGPNLKCFWSFNVIHTVSYSDVLVILVRVQTRGPLCYFEVWAHVATHTNRTFEQDTPRFANTQPIE